MKTTKMLTILVVVLASASMAHGGQSLTVNNQPLDSVTLKVGQTCTVEVVSDDSNPYNAYVGFDDGLVLGTFSHLETKKKKAGDLADAMEYNVSFFYGYYISAAGVDPPPSPGVHFVFQYQPQQVGETELKLYDQSLTLELDSVHITVVPAEMGTAFTYQGRLLDANDAANGLYDFEFELYDAPSDGNQLGSTIDINDLDVIDGYFTVELDYGSVYDGNGVWLEIGVRAGELEDPNVYTTLSPRQRIRPTPYALYATAATSLSAADGTPANVVYVDEVGNVGISTMSPGAKLDVAGNQNIRGNLNFSELLSTIGFAKDGQINLNGNLTVTSVLSGTIGAGTSMELEAGNTMDLQSGATMTITTPLLDIAAPINVQSNLSVDGQVGIGTTNPDRNLDIHHSNTGGGIEIDRSVSTIWSGLVYENNGAENWFIGVQANSDDLLFKDNTAGVSLLIEDITGNVGIGTTDPWSKLSVGGYGVSSTGIYGEGSGYGVYGKASAGISAAGVYGKALNGIDAAGVYGQGCRYGVKAYCYDDVQTNYGISVTAGSNGSNSAEALNAKVLRDGSGTYWSGYFCDVGSGGTYNGLYADYRSGAAIDLAEFILDTFDNTKPADVVVADPDNDESVIKSSKPFDSSVVGVISTDPHMVMGMELVMDEETGEMYEDVNAARLTVTGRIPVKVTDENGPIQRGDLLTTSSKPGYAMKWSLLDVNQAKDFEELKSMLAENERRHHSILGKALASHESGDGKIIALLSLQ